MQVRHVGSGAARGGATVGGRPSPLAVVAPRRGQGSALPPARPQVGLPPRPFLYTVDQLSVMLDVTEGTILKSYLYFEGQSIGTRHNSLMTARNIAPPDERPDWRVAEREFIRWMRVKGFRYYERSAFTN